MWRSNSFISAKVRHAVIYSKPVTILYYHSFQTMHFRRKRITVARCSHQIFSVSLNSEVRNEIFTPRELLICFELTDRRFERSRQRIKAFFWRLFFECARFWWILKCRWRSSPITTSQTMMGCDVQKLRGRIINGNYK